MARKLRIQYPGAINHAMNGGDHQERILCDDEARQQFFPRDMLQYIEAGQFFSGL